MKSNKYLKIILYIFFLYIIYDKVSAQDLIDENNKNEEDNKNSNVDNKANNSNDIANNNDNNSNNVVDNNNSNNSNNNENNEKNEDNQENNKSKEEEEEERECSSSIGNILFQKPDSKSIVVPYSNFTLIWYYDNRGFDVVYPSVNITFLLFKSEDANYNDYINAWKNPIFTKTLKLSEIQPGPQRTDGKPVYQWDWDTNFYSDEESYTQPPSLNAQYKFRIVGDGKDIKTNADHFDCYRDGDLTPGSTSAFYIVENKPLGNNYKPLVIENSALSIYKSAKFMTTIIILFIVSVLLVF
ncbi:hypothetical protein H8356DRAFT_1689538 [Neocallimastix lanati (nom. inval.)]|jgi:hypothetical protein|uniref:Uncharacterized protein n=1 Tax=Neocallimastix californiae TaxID=1754190 RepID=A0A1Y2F3K7_9FUNG|nr:hypothetical protein H8356DRAFT_1689538 [Neocallimastix sp. JGI-2020a]ORY77535.1 hypothetical protein LY90DRAFT_665309 [Neocallimastix californiae]|eukprot:ORY77535.1 hypothetical protein LY90DRAFT_665309 [Neocallimastix californiae]